MRRTTLLLTGLLMAIAMQAATTTDTITVRIKGMRCEECAHKVNTVLHKLNGVKGITVQPISNGAIYDLQGRRVVKPLKGIYVKDGKKMIIK